MIPPVMKDLGLRFKRTNKQELQRSLSNIFPVRPELFVHWVGDQLRSEQV